MLELLGVLEGPESVNLVADAFFLFGYFVLLLGRSLSSFACSFLLGFFGAGIALVGLQMVWLALISDYAGLLLLTMLFIVGLLLAFVTNARGGYFAGRRITRK
jgi:hypothetical protein